MVAIKAIAARRHTAPDGTRRAISERTIRAWIAAHEAKGLAGLQRKPRADRRRRRVTITRAWDRGTGFDDDKRTGVAAALRRYVRSLWAAGATSWREVQRLATARLVKLTREAGSPLPDSELFGLCRLTRPFVETERRYRMVAVHDNDAKKFFDKFVPRIARTRAGLAPLEIVVGDVHPVDILYRRDDGSTATPKAIAWHDVATNRVFVDLVFLEKGKGIRREHVARSFIAMTQHAEWGMPRSLYLDNGGEFGFADFIDDAMRLAGLACGYLSDAGKVRAIIDRARRSMVVRARPYNAPAKPIEGIFGILEARYFSMIPGWIGGDRMRKKTQNVGKEPIPFPGRAEDLRRAIETAVDCYHTTPQNGHLKGITPRQAFADFVGVGWQRVDIDPHALEAAFADEFQRQVDRGTITLEGETYYADELLAFTDRTVRVRVPLIGAGSRVVILQGDGTFICAAEPQREFGFLDPAGAEEQARRNGELRADVRAMKRDIDPVNRLAASATVAALHPPAPTPESAGTIRLSEEHEAAGAALKELPAPKKIGRMEKASRDLAAVSENLARLAAVSSGKKRS